MPNEVFGPFLLKKMLMKMMKTAILESLSTSDDDDVNTGASKI